MDVHQQLQNVLDFFRESPPARWTLLSIALGFTLVGGWRRIETLQSTRRLKAAAASDPSLLAKHSSFEGFTTPSGYTYPRIRIFFKPHLNADKLPKSIPLLVFTHGLGGSSAQYVPLLTSLINHAPCLAIDLPGCGRSDFAPKNSQAYTTHALAELVATVVNRYRDADDDQEVVLVGHSLGCSINVLLGSSTSPLFDLMGSHIISMIAICPRGDPPRAEEVAAVRRLTWLPSPLFDLIRLFDRRGGTASRSVTRIVGESADEDTRKMQLRFNVQSESATFIRIIAAGLGADGMPGKDIWSGIKVPLFLVGGDSDGITPAEEVDKIAAWLTRSPTLDGTEKPPGSSIPPLLTTTGDTAAAQRTVAPKQPNPDPPRMDSGTVIQDSHTSTKHAFALKSTKFPAPAAHGLLYATSTVRILSGMIENFLAHHVDERLGASWQLQHLTTSGKWDVKNLKKWQAVDACSEPIGGIFRAMKTMREVDPEHSPKEFVKRYSAEVLDDGVAVVIDISHETPVYHPQGLEEAGVKYHKFPTVSKEVPRPEEVDHFIALVDKLRRDPKFKGDAASNSSGKHPTIGVHCHYGFNRTGAMIVAYLVERRGYKLQDALQEFGTKRPPGIKHDHFINELYVRYAVKMERRGTVIGF